MAAFGSPFLFLEKLRQEDCIFESAKLFVDFRLSFTTLVLKLFPFQETMMKRLAVAVCLLLGLGAPVWTTGAAVTDEISAEDAIAIHTAVQTQLDAFADDDADGAFELATSDTQTKIGSADNFLYLVKTHYNPIYRHQVVIFSRPEIIEGEIIQLVRVTDRDSHVWLALYHMQRETDGRWKIDGCQLFETTSISI